MPDSLKFPENSVSRYHARSLPPVLRRGNPFWAVWLVVALKLSKEGCPTAQVGKARSGSVVGDLDWNRQFGRGSDGRSVCPVGSQNCNSQVNAVSMLMPNLALAMRSEAPTEVLESNRTEGLRGATMIGFGLGRQSHSSV
jgi:hypothetical protein